MSVPAGRSAKTERLLAEKVVLAAMLAYALLAIEMQAVEFRSFVPPVGFFNLAAALVVIVPLLMRWRWAPLLAPIVSLAVIAAVYPFIVLDLTHPSESPHGFVWTVLALMMFAIASAAGIVATIQQRRASGERA